MLNFHEQFGHPGSWSLKHPLNIAKDTRRWSPEVSKAAISALCRRIWWWIHSLLKNKGSKQTCSTGKILVISREQYCELMEECKKWTLLEVFQDILRFKGSLFERLIQRTYLIFVSGQSCWAAVRFPICHKNWPIRRRCVVLGLLYTFCGANHPHSDDRRGNLYTAKCLEKLHVMCNCCIPPQIRSTVMYCSRDSISKASQRCLRMGWPPQPPQVLFKMFKML